MKDQPPDDAVPIPVPVVSTVRRGRPTVVDEALKNKIVVLLGAGLSLNLTSSYLGISRHAISNALANDAEFQQEIADARQRARLLPLNCILRESARNWKAAVWLLQHLDRQANQDKTREEREYESARQTASTLIEMSMAKEIADDARKAREAKRGTDGTHGVPKVTVRRLKNGAIQRTIHGSP